MENQDQAFGFLARADQNMEAVMDARFQRYHEAYIAMAKRAKYRPAIFP